MHYSRHEEAGRGQEVLSLERIDHVALTVQDVDRAEAFYTRLGFQCVLKIPRATFLQCGDAILALFPARAIASKIRGAVRVRRDPSRRGGASAPSPVS
ncbi:MAG: VOC family protein, partial [Armatimonadetes bacterium]|nr:VOC family protein [Armatimonadota bacterium]